MRTSGTILALAVAAVATFDAVAATPMPASGELSCQSAHLGECDYLDPTTDLLLVWPRDWPAQRLKVVTDTGPPARAHQLDAIRWISYEYVPTDPAQPQASLFQVAVLRRHDWIRQSTTSQLATGTEVAGGSTGRVAIAALPPVNPYPPDSRDADIYDALRPTMREISLIVQFAESRHVPGTLRFGDRGVDTRLSERVVLASDHDGTCRPEACTLSAD